MGTKLLMLIMVLFKNYWRLVAVGVMAFLVYCIVMFVKHVANNL